MAYQSYPSTSHIHILCRSVIRLLDPKSEVLEYVGYGLFSRLRTAEIGANPFSCRLALRKLDFIALLQHRLQHGIDLICPRVVVAFFRSVDADLDRDFDLLAKDVFAGLVHTCGQ